MHSLNMLPSNDAAIHLLAITAILIFVVHRVRIPPWTVPRRSYRVEIGEQDIFVKRTEPVRLPPLILAGSRVISLFSDPGLGIFAAQRSIAMGPPATKRNVPNAVPAIRKGQIITEYGGRLIGYNEAKALRDQVNYWICKPTSLVSSAFPFFRAKPPT